ncbi:hypothetical protein M8C17_19870 [Micromonospora sp. RHAY321]|uniref:hypothetical protein n=1 Tax=Micromonospora sp. RHAY321 TaxID=2944807 RepID=UPI00207C35AD|nr:hypothetical protein [Micromonospora sp. RHAY321]MCO1597413.1 hypothetical protein [Micromonospora sp. RHAY321]
MTPADILVRVLGAAIGTVVGSLLAPVGRQLGVPAKVTAAAGMFAGQEIAVRIVRTL